MKKMKMYIVLVALTLVTAGVFAAKSIFVVNYQLYALTGSASAVPIDDGSGVLNSTLQVGKSGVFTNLVTIKGVNTFAVLAYALETPAGYVYSNSNFDPIR